MTEMEIGRGRGSPWRNGQARVTGTRMGKGKVLLTKPQGGEDISSTIGWQLQKEMYKVHSDMEG